MHQANYTAIRTALPASWNMVLEDTVERYNNTRCERFTDELVLVQNGMPLPVPHTDPVLEGISRKTAQRLRHICTCCGKPAKPRAILGGWQVKCAACWGKSQLAEQVQRLLEEAHESSLSPFDGRQALWYEQALPVLLRNVIPDYCWRKLSLPCGATLRHLAREDVLELAPWLLKLQLAMGHSTSGV